MINISNSEYLDFGKQRESPAFGCGSTSGVMLENVTLVPEAEKVYRALGYRDLSRVQPAIRSTTQSVVTKLTDNTQTSVGYSCVDLNSISGDTIVVGNDVAFHCQAFPSYLAGCGRLVAFALTLGPTIDEKIAAYISQDQLLEAVILEAASWIAMEQLTKMMALQMSAKARNSGLLLSRRMAPGYRYKIDGKGCEWPLSEQKLLFELFDPVSQPIHLLESCTMVPKMSRSGIYGLFPKHLQNVRTRNRGIS